MRSSALAFLALVLLGTAAARHLAGSARRPVAPLGCGEVVALRRPNGIRLACRSDEALSKCGTVAAGREYRGCRPVGFVRGPVLAMRGEPIDVDLAPADDLRALPGIGETFARRLVEARRRRPFCALADLKRVKGLGPKRLVRLAGHVAFGAPLCGKAPAR